jgi:integrase
MADRKRRGRGEGSVYLDGDRWVGTVSLGYTGTGKRRRRKVYGSSKKEVMEKLRNLQVRSPLLSDAASLTLGEYLQRWLENTAKVKVRPTTYQRYEQLVRLHVIPHLGSVKLAKLEAMHLEQFYADLTRAEAGTWTQKMAGTLLSNALRRAVKLKLIPTNPAADYDNKPRPAHREMRTLTPEQTRQFLQFAAEYRLKALFVLATATGMRQGELLGLKWEDIDFAGGKLTVRRSLAEVGKEFLLKEPKSKQSRRTIRVPRYALDALLEHRKAMLAEGNLSALVVFCTKNGNYIRKSNLIRYMFQAIFKRANKAIQAEAEKLGIEPVLLPVIRFHDLRHTHATQLLTQGHSIKAVSQRLGHASVELTLRHYAHVLPGDDDRLAEALDRLYA